MEWIGVAAIPVALFLMYLIKKQQDRSLERWIDNHASSTISRVLQRPPTAEELKLMRDKLFDRSLSFSDRFTAAMSAVIDPVWDAEEKAWREYLAGVRISTQDIIESFKPEPAPTVGPTISSEPGFGEPTTTDGKRLPDRNGDIISDALRQTSYEACEKVIKAHNYLQQAANAPLMMERLHKNIDFMQAYLPTTEEGCPTPNNQRTITGRTVREPEFELKIDRHPSEKAEDV